ncbi:MAG: TRAP transporter large permease [Deltaproteobacteria bacterium]|nr:TRAP transporter large permease [Deltaproteobacteria bacterium]
MSLFTASLIFIVMLLILLLLRMSVGLAMALIGFIGFAYITNMGGAYGQLRIVPISLTANYDYCVIPLFMLMGSLGYHCGLSQDLYYGAHKWVGDLPGGLAIATVLGCCGFAAVCGSTLATAATMGMVALPEMKKYNYDPALATGVVASGGSLGILIPPSSIFIIYGLLTEQSIGSLFIAGILPGLLLAGLFIVVIYIMVKVNPTLGPPTERIPLKEKVASIKHMWPVLGLFLVIMGGLYMGLFTPTEAAGVGAFGALLTGLIKKRLTWQKLIASLLEAIQSTAMIFVIIIGAMIFGYFLTASRFTAGLADFVAGFEASRYVILLGVTLVYIVLGLLMDTLSMVILTVPIFFPLIIKLGFDPLWFGVIMVLISEMSVITPPVGMNVYVLRGIAKDVPMFTIFRGTLPFFAVMVLCIIIITIFPQIALFLPNIMGN